MNCHECGGPVGSEAWESGDHSYCSLRCGDGVCGNCGKSPAPFHCPDCRVENYCGDACLVEHHLCLAAKQTAMDSVREAVAKGWYYSRSGRKLEMSPRQRQWLFAYAGEHTAGSTYSLRFGPKAATIHVAHDPAAVIEVVEYGKAVEAAVRLDLRNITISPSLPAKTVVAWLNDAATSSTLARRVAITWFAVRALTPSISPPIKVTVRDDVCPVRGAAGAATSTEISLCKRSLDPAFEKAAPRVPAAGVKHYSSMVLHEVGHVLDKRDRLPKGVLEVVFRRGRNDGEVRADEYAKWVLGRAGNLA